MAILSTPADHSNSAERRARQHFEVLTPDERRQAIFRLADNGYSDHGIASATRFSLEMVRQVLADRVAA